MPSPTNTPAWAEISLGALKNNFKALAKTARGSQILPVIKANAYGHGAVPVSQALLQAGAGILAVATVQEGAELRAFGVDVPILVLTPTLKEEIPDLLDNALTPQVSSLGGAIELAQAAKKMKSGPVPVHVKIDTGMGRLGVKLKRVLDEIQAIRKVEGLKVEAVYSHLATADWTDPKYAWKQITQFNQALETLRQKENFFPMTHVANSAALLTYFPQSAGTWVRPGIALYGIYPNPAFKNRVALIPVMQVKAKIIHLKKIEKGQSVSYGRTYTAQKPVSVATVALGYADGVHRNLSNKCDFLVGGRRVPQIGTVCMDMVMLDVSKVKNVKVGDEAVFFGRQGKAQIGVEEQASLAGTISYELLCAVGERVTRVYT
jgi:alanine racemase